MPTPAQLDQAFQRPGRMVPAIQRFGGGSVAVGEDGLPVRAVGTQAAIYLVRGPGGEDIAVRAWLPDEVPAAVIARYAALANPATWRRLRPDDRSPLPSILHLDPQGLALPGTGLGSTAAPVVITEWIPGGTLQGAADALALRGESRALARLATRWAEVADALESMRFVHGNITPGNVMLRADAQLVLVDFDTCWWPGLQVPAQVLAAPQWRHPGGARELGQGADRFAALLLYASLRVLAAYPDLRATSGDPVDTPDGALLFDAADLADPAHSPLFRTLRQADNREVRALAAILAESCRVGPEEVPILADARSAIDLALGRPPRSAGTGRAPAHPVPAKRSTKPRQPDPKPDEWPSKPEPLPAYIRRRRTPVPDAPVLDSGNPTWGRTDLHADLRRAIERGDDRTVAELWPALRGEPEVAPWAIRADEIVTRLTVAEIADAIASGDDIVLIEAVERAEDRGVAVGPGARRAVRRARARIDRRDRVHLVLASGDRDEMLALLASGQVDGDDARLDDATRRGLHDIATLQPLLFAIERDDDRAILRSLRAIGVPPGQLPLDERARNRLQRAIDRERWLQEVRTAVTRRDVATLETALPDAPPGATDRLSAVERRRISRLVDQHHAIAALHLALRDGDDGDIIEAVQAIDACGGVIPADIDWQVLVGVIERIGLATSVRRAAGGDEPNLTALARLVPLAREQLGDIAEGPGRPGMLARWNLEVHREAHRNRLRDALERQDDAAVAAAADPDPLNILPTLTDAERAAVAEALAERERYYVPIPKPRLRRDD